jgi:similar to stage IV sporulation protein
VRKNSIGAKNIAGVYVVYEVNGLNLDRFINTVKKRGIWLFDIKKRGAKQLIVSVSYKDSENFFAIAKELCYNIKKVRYKGKGYPVFALARSFSMVLGALLFSFMAYFANDHVFSFSYSGSGSVYEREVQQYLSANGVVPFVRFSSLDLARLEDGILADNPHLSFVSLTKHGSRLNLELVLSKDKPEKLKGDVYELVAPVDAIVESIKVYRGTAEVKEGDVVKKGDLLVGGYAFIKEQTVKINLLACVTLLASEQDVYCSQKDNEEQNARLFALAQAGEKDVLSLDVKKEFDGKQYIYTTTVNYRLVIYAG